MPDATERDALNYIITWGSYATRIVYNATVNSWRDPEGFLAELKKTFNVCEDVPS